VIENDSQVVTLEATKEWSATNAPHIDVAVHLAEELYRVDDDGVIVIID